MAVPKRKTSKSKRDQRRAHWKIEAPKLVECSSCHQLKKPHHVCANCGTYDGEKVLELE